MHHTDALMAQKMEKTIIVLIEHSSAETSAHAAERLNNNLKKTNLFSKTDKGFNQDTFLKNLRFYKKHHYGLLTSSQIETLEQNNLAAIRANVIAKTYRMSMDISGINTKEDPLFLFTDYITNTMDKSLNNASLINDIPVFTKHAKHFSLLQLTLTENPFSLAYQDKVIKALDQAQSALIAQAPNLNIIRSGFIFHAHNGAQIAKQESSFMGGLSLLGVLLLMLWVFKSIKPFLVVGLSIIGGALAGFATCLLFFNQVHILTLVFGTSLIGISVDYALHFFAAKEDLDDWNANKVINHIFPGITLGLLTSLVGFIALCTTPFLGLQQMALFCMAGLIFVYSCVVLVYPSIFKKAAFQQASPSIKKIMLRYIFWWENRSFITIKKFTVLLFILCLLCLPFLKGKDDIRALQSLSPSLIQNDTKAADILGHSLSAQYLIVKGSNDDNMQENLEDLIPHLNDLKQSGALGNYKTLNLHAPSQKLQRNNAQLLRKFMTDNKGKIQNLFSELSYPENLYDQYLAFLNKAIKDDTFFSLNDVRANTSNPEIDALYGGDYGDEKISFINLSNIQNLSAVSSLQKQSDNIVFIDKVSSLSQLLNHYRFTATLQAIGAYALIFLFLIFRYGIKRGTALITPSILAAIITLSLVTLTQGSYSLFHIIALFLVMGIGMDYGLFIAESKKHTSSALVAIILSALTTLLSFGLLSGSDTSALHDFGITITIGIAITVLLLPLITITFNSETRRK